MKKVFLIVLFFGAQNCFGLSSNDKITYLNLENGKSETYEFKKSSKPTVLYFWASWCLYCKDILPFLNPSVLKEFDFLPISFDVDRLKALKYAKNNLTEFKNVYLINDFEKYKPLVTTFPTTVIVNRNGDIDTVYEGSQIDKYHYFEKRMRYLIERE